MNKGFLKMAVALLLIFGGVFGFVAGKNYMIRKYIAGMKRPPVAVSTAVAQAEAWEKTVNAVGSLQARRGTDLSAEVKGVVQAIRFRPGEAVAEGAVLIELDDRIEAANLKSLEAQQRLAEINYDRAQKLIASHAISKTDFDTIEARMKDAVAQTERSRALVDKMHIRAPFAGRAGVPLVKVGEYVSEGRALVTLQSPDQLYVEFALPERYAQGLSLGQKVNFHTDSDPGQLFTARISAVNVKVDDNTRSVLVRADVDPFKGALMPGMFANAEVVLQSGVPVVTVPQTAIAYSLYGNTVYVVRDKAGEDGKPGKVVERVYVQPGDHQGERVAIDSGLSAGDQVVTAGQVKLANDTAVVIDNSVSLQGH